MRFNLPGRVSSGQVVYFTRQLALMLRSGIPLVKSLYTISRQVSNPDFSHILSSIAVQVEQGDKLSEALSRFPSIFPPYYINMVKVAEVGGVLDEVFRRLAIFLEKQDKLKKKILSSLAYPLFILLVAVTILLIIMGLVVPAFMKMFREYGETLPLPTRILLSTSNFIRAYWWTLPLALFLLVIVLSFMRRSYVIRYRLDALLLSLPILGGILRRFYIGRFCQTLGTLLSSGVPIVEALRVVEGTIGNEVVKDIIRRLILLIQEGEDMTSLLRSYPKIFPPLAVEMISVGEETGNLPQMLLDISDIYEEEIDLIVSSFTSVLEPFLIVFMGVIVGFIVISMFLPLFTLTQTMAQ